MPVVMSSTLFACPDLNLTAEHAIDAQEHGGICRHRRPLGLHHARTSLRSAEDLVTEALQAEWNDHAGDFATSIDQTCHGRSDEETIPDSQDRHTADDVWGNLDTCYADEEPGPNYLYGALYAVVGIARRLNLNIDQRFPEPERIPD